MSEDQHTIWVKKALKELRNKDLNSIDWQINNRLSISPIYFDLPSTLAEVRPPGPNMWRAGESIEGNNPEQLNTHIHKALNHGIDSPLIQVEEVWKLEYILHEISRPNIHVVLQPTSDEALVHCLDFLDPTMDMNTQVWISNTFKEVERHSNVFTIFSEGHDFEESDVDLSLSDVFYRVIDWLEKDQDRSSQNIVLQVHLGKQFYLSIGKLLAIKLIWLNLKEALSLKSKFLLDVTITGPKNNVEPETCIIDSTTQCIAAIFGRGDRITLPNISKRKWKNAPYFHKIIRNIHAILKLESGMETYSDIVEGSYYFNHIGAQIANSVWHDLIKKMG